MHQCPSRHIRHMVLQMLPHMVPYLILLLMVPHQTFLEEVHIHHPLVLIHLLFMELHPVSCCFILEDNYTVVRRYELFLKWLKQYFTDKHSKLQFSKIWFLNTRLLNSYLQPLRNFIFGLPPVYIIQMYMTIHLNKLTVCTS